MNYLHIRINTFVLDMNSVNVKMNCHQIRSDLERDLEFIRVYMRYCRYLGTFLWSLKKEIFRLNFLSKCYSFLVMVLLLVGITVTYPERIEFVYTFMQTPEIMVDVLKHLVEYSSILVILCGVLRSADT